MCRAPRETLERRELAPFREHVGADAVMTAHVVYPALDPERPATFSRRVLHDLLRDELGFQGICITDALEMKGASGERSLAEAARLAIEAGCDLLLFAFHNEDVRRARLELAKQLVDGAIDHTNFDAARPRLAAFDARRPEPTAAELGRTLESLTPAGWEERLAGIIDRGMVMRDSPTSRPGWAPRDGVALGAIEVIEPAWPTGRSLGEELAALGVPARAATDGAAGEAAVFVIEAIASRVPLGEAAIAAMRERCRTRPTALVAFQSDAFLDQVDEAALRISACDATALTRQRVARRLAAYLGDDGAHRAPLTPSPAQRSRGRRLRKSSSQASSSRPAAVAISQSGNLNSLPSHASAK